MGSLCFDPLVGTADGSPPVELGQAPEAYGPYAMAFFDAAGSFENRLVCFCAEPGMGARDVLSFVLSSAERQGFQVFRRNMGAYTPEGACRYLTKKAREIEELGPLAVVGLDSIPPSDEFCVARQARAIRRMWMSGASVVFSLSPEARQLLEELPDCQELTPSTVDVQGRWASGSKFTRDLLSYTRAIPSLVGAVGSREDSPGRGDSGRSVVLLPAYYDALGELVELAVRPSLIDEERRLRLCMLLLGRGSREDLLEVVGEAPDDILGGIRRDAPLFGVSDDLGSFCTLLSVAPNALAFCQRSLLVCSALFPDIAAGCFGVLTRRGELGRAAVLARIPECDGAIHLVIERAADYIDEGEEALVRHALDQAEGQGGPATELVRAALSAVFDRRPRLGRKGARMQKPATAGEEVLFIDSRRILRGMPLLSLGEAVPDGELRRALATHVGACSLMLRGAFALALNHLTRGFEEVSSGRLSDALLTLDRGIAYFLAGGVPRPCSEGEIWARGLLETRPFLGCWGYAALFRLICTPLSEELGEPWSPEHVAARAERTGDAVVRIVALVVGSLRDMAANATVRAKVRASLALDLARQVDSDYLVRVADLVGVVSRYLAGARVEPRVADASADDLEAVASLVLEALSEEGRTLLLAPLPDRVPWDALWMLRALCGCSRRVSGPLMGVMPSDWARALIASSPPGKTEEEHDDAPQVPSLGGAFAGDSGGEGARPVEVRLLGGFSVSINGRRVPDSQLEKRSVKSMLEYLILRGGSARRFQLVEQLWPGCDYAMGFNRVYQATSAIRAFVSEVDESLSLIAANRTSGEVSVDMGLIRCDVEEFRRVARAAVDCEDDVETLEFARAAERVYVGDLYAPSSDSTGCVAALRADLRSLYSDAMVEGSSAALRLGRARTAARLAGNALLANDLREDAVIALVRALKACGRAPEAERQRSAYEARVRRSEVRSSRERRSRARRDPARTREVVEA